MKPSSQIRKLAIVIPAWNEEGSLASMIGSLRKLVIPGVSLDIIVVDDGSVDHTREVALRCGAYVVSHPFNLGIGMAVQTGFKIAIERGAELVVQMDGDGQHPPRQLLRLVQGLSRHHADVVIGSRFVRGARDLSSTSGYRWVGGRILSLLIRMLTGLRITDPTSGFRLYNRRAAQVISGNYSDDYPEVTALITFRQEGLRIVEVPVNMRPRERGVSSINAYRSVYYMTKVTLASVMARIRSRKYA